MLTLEQQISELFQLYLDFLDNPEAPRISLINQDTKLGGQTLPYLARTGKKWTICAEPNPVAKGSGQLVRWVNGRDIHDLYLEDTPWTKTAIAQTLGLRISMAKGGFRASKRFSRLMRPYHMHMFLPDDDVHIRYLAQDPTRDKIFDGAGIVSRKLLLKLSAHLETLPLSPRLRRKYQHELATTLRVEFTIQNKAGQDKGHAIVSEDLDDDFLLIHDTKTEVQATDTMTFIGIVPVHSHDHMRLDIQSLINLHGDAEHPFWTNEQLLAWLHDTGIVFQQALENGDIAEPMHMLDGDSTLEDIQAWAVREYFASKGQTLWFQGIIKTLMNQHLKQIRATTLDNMRLPLPGGRYYVMPVGVGQTAGLKLKVRRGHVLIDDQTCTAWINDKDWLHLRDSPIKAGIAKILGGADNDDALWVYPFTDDDGQQQILLWRSPNQLGEYIVLKPEAHSETMLWFDGSTYSSFPHNDSRKLPPRIDTTTPDYLDLVQKDNAFKDVPYSIEAMFDTVQRTQLNEGALGMYCNLLMLSQALYGRQPKQPAARLEEIIDASVKTGDDLSLIKQYCYASSQAIIDTKCAIPRLLWKRLSVQRDENTPRPKLTATRDHWLDQLLTGIRYHITTFTAQRDALMTNANPPLEIFQYATEHNLLQQGGEFNALYARALPETNQIEALPERYDLARQTCEAYLVSQRDRPHQKIF